MKRTTALSAKMPIGNLDTKIVFVAITETQTDTGHAVQRMDDVHEDFAAIEYSGGSMTGSMESYEADRQISTTSTLFWVRSHSASQNITVKHRIREKQTGQVYDIEGITEPMGRWRFIKFQCKLRE
jgi:head-tail adaptor